MLSIRQKFDQHLLDLAWSLWTELGVAGNKQNHQQYLITIEELILFTTALADIDPRLRDESLDWCSQYHRLISVSRLKSLIKDFKVSLSESFSIYAATLNSFSQANWPVLFDVNALKIKLSHKSCLRSLESPALLNVRARSIFGTSARADLLTFFLTHKNQEFSASDLTEINYSKRNLAEMLEEFCMSGIFDKISLRNQQKYRLVKYDYMAKILAPIPKYAPHWKLIFEVLLSIREYLKRTENYSEMTKVVEIRNLLELLHEKLKRINLTPPALKTNLETYLGDFYSWLNKQVHSIANGNLSK